MLSRSSRSTSAVDCSDARPVSSAKFPLKRLGRILSCGCDEIAPNTFFIDRNPQHFEVVLDWYRTGRCVKRDGINEQLLRDDAVYFDLLEELFPATTTTAEKPSAPAPAPAPTQAVVTPSPSLSRQSPIEPPSPAPRRPSRAVPSTPSVAPPSDPNAAVCLSTRETASLRPHGPPHVVQVWRHQHLVVESVRGRGKLLVRVCDRSGLERVVVDHAVLFDSRSCFYLHDGRARLQRCVLPGDHLYSLWMEPHSEPSPTNKAPPAAPTRVPKDKGKAGARATAATTAAAAVETVVEPVMDVELRVISTFARREEVSSRDDQELLKELTTGGAWTVDHSNNPSGSGAGSDGVRCLFLPPHLTPEPKEDPTVLPSPNDSREPAMVDRDAIVEQLLGTKSIAATPSPKPTTKSSNAVSSAIKRSGAAIAGVHGGERVVVYQQDKLPTNNSSSSSRGNSRSNAYANQQPRQLR
ncbi:hypothetical protein PINS_up005311 [Pythium insidiosum]|nr:hypothetical protein PINS_up005311 [Pythium insidiosum]